MTIEVCAKLPGRSVFLAGETLECCVTFRNIPRIKKDGSPAKWVVVLRAFVNYSSLLYVYALFIWLQNLWNKMLQEKVWYHSSAYESQVSPPPLPRCPTPPAILIVFKSQVISFRSRVAKLAWASAQIHCQCSVSEARVELPYGDVLSADQLSASSNDTSFIPFRGKSIMLTITHSVAMLLLGISLL